MGWDVGNCQLFRQGDRTLDSFLGRQRRWRAGALSVWVSVVVAIESCAVEGCHGAGGVKGVGADGFLLGVGALLGELVVAGPVAGLGADGGRWGGGEGCEEV